MDVFVDLSSHVLGDSRIIQVVGEAGDYIPINGRFILPMSSEVPVDQDSYVLPVDSGSIVYQGFAHLLAQYPQMSYIHFNPLLTAADYALLDMSSVIEDPVTFDSIVPRLQTGSAAGMMPMHTAILPQNDTVVPSFPGLLLTNSVDFSVHLPLGADTFMVYWKLYSLEIEQDVRSEHGGTAGENAPAIKRLVEMEQEPADFELYIRGGSLDPVWNNAGLLESVTLSSGSSTEFQLAFFNRSPHKIYLAQYAVMAQQSAPI